MKPQVNNNHYFSKEYNNIDRLNSYSLQINLIRKAKPKKILEIGIGNRFVSRKLKEFGYLVTTVDIDQQLNPDIVADITKLPISDKAFDSVAAFEVLEHLPFSKFNRSIKELKRVSKKSVIFSVPDVSRQYPLVIPCLKRIIKKLINKPQHFSKHNFDGQHYWEIGRKNYELGKIIMEIKKAGLSVQKTFIDKKVPNRRFFILKV